MREKQPRGSVYCLDSLAPAASGAVCAGLLRGNSGEDQNATEPPLEPALPPELTPPAEHAAVTVPARPDDPDAPAVAFTEAESAAEAYRTVEGHVTVPDDDPGPVHRDASLDHVAGLDTGDRDARGFHGPLDPRGRAPGTPPRNPDQRSLAGIVFHVAFVTPGPNQPLGTRTVPKDRVFTVQRF